MALSAFAQPGGVTITSTATQVIVTTPVSSKSMPICDFNWAITSGGGAGVADDNLRIWQTDSRDPIPSGQLRFFTIDGVTDNALKDEALGDITSQCNPGALNAAQIPLSPAIDFGGVPTDTVQEALEAIDARLDSAFLQNNGRVLYVSKSGWQGTGTEIVGNPKFPWRDPWAAKAVAVSGDLIKILPDTYTMGHVGSGADKEGATTDRVGQSLFKNGITYYAYPNVVIENIANVEMQVFYDTLGGTCRFLGKATIKHVGIIDGLIDVDDDLTELTLECENFIIGDGTNWINAEVVIQRHKSVKIKARKLDINNAIFLANYGIITNCSYGETQLDIDEIYSINTDAIWTTNNICNKVITRNVKNFYLEQEFTSLGLGSAGLKRCEVTWNIGTLIAKIDPGGSAQSGLFTHSSRNVDSSVVNVNIGVFTTEMELFQSSSETQQDTAYVLNMNLGTVYYKGAYANPFNFLSISGQVNFNATVHDLSVHTGLFTANSTVDDLNLSGYIKTDDEALNISGNGVTLNNLTIRNAGLVAPVISAAAQTIGCQNVFANSTVVDADVTEAIQPITRNSNVK